ncbi:[protein release factor]-glutamine N5-methyltransferase [Lachnospiraceae bacterium]|nr:[protein release factor]-glutamine N5-methyltransferase [Lachnospiraceae bacterium]
MVESDIKYGEKTIGGLIIKGSKILSDAGIENAKAEARLMMAEYTQKDMASLYAGLKDVLDDFTAMRYMKSIKKRAKHYPFQYIIGYTYFMDYKFICREKVLIPRFDTENLVLHALELSPGKDIRVLDMCTGSGCIGISYNLIRNKEGYNDEIYLTDISDDALRLAEDNRKKLRADVKVLKSDLFEAFEPLAAENGEIPENDRFDLIISNPPYIRTKAINNLIKDVRDFEPRLALDGSMDGLDFYRRIIKDARRFLKEDGRLAFEIGSDQYMAVSDLMKKEGFKHIKKLKDMSGLDRVVSGVL